MLSSRTCIESATPLVFESRYFFRYSQCPRSQLFSLRRPVDQSHSRSQLLEERKLLPVHQASADLSEILASHNVVIIVGETGSGKTTQVPAPSPRA